MPPLIHGLDAIGVRVELLPLGEGGGLGVPGRLLCPRLGPPVGQRLLLLDGAKDHGQADALQQVHIYHRAARY